MGLGIVEGLPMGAIAAIIGVMGTPGLVLIFWYIDHRKIEAIRREDNKVIHDILKEYKEDVRKVSNFYEKNVRLVERYEKLSDELTEIIHLNTQAQTKLVEKIENNMFCPVVREKGPHS